MLVSEVGLPTRTQAPILRPQNQATEVPAPVVTPDANAPAAKVATAKAEVQIRLAFEFGVRLSFDSKSSPVGRSDREGIEAYDDENDEEGNDRVAKLAKGMTKALGRAIKEGLRAFFGDEDGLSKADREALKELEHDLKGALKDAYKSNRNGDEMDLLGFATDALSAVQNFAQSFGEFYAGAFASGDAADSGAVTSGAIGATGSPAANRSPSSVDVPAPFVGVTDTPVLVSRVDPTAPTAAAPSTAVLPTDPAGDRFGGFGRIGGFGSPQASFDRVSSLLERITTQLQGIVDSLQPKETAADPVVPTIPAVATPSFQAQMELTASFTLEASVNLVA